MMAAISIAFKVTNLHLTCTALPHCVTACRYRWDTNAGPTLFKLFSHKDIVTLGHRGGRPWLLAFRRIGRS